MKMYNFSISEIMGLSLKSYKFEDLLEREDGWVQKGMNNENRNYHEFTK